MKKFWTLAALLLVTMGVLLATASRAGEFGTAYSASTPRIKAVTYAASITPTADGDVFNIGTLTGNVMVNAPSFTAPDGKEITFRFTNDFYGTRFIDWDQATYQFTETLRPWMLRSEAGVSQEITFRYRQEITKWVAITLRANSLAYPLRKQYNSSGSASLRNGPTFGDPDTLQPTAKFFVNQSTGLDTRTGTTVAQAVQTLTKAFQLAGANDVIVIIGTYDLGTDGFDIPHSVAGIVGTTAGTSKITSSVGFSAASSNGYTGTINLVSDTVTGQTNNILIADITLENTHDGATGLYGSCLGVKSTSHTAITGIRIDNVTFNGISICQTCDNVLCGLSAEFTNCTFTTKMAAIQVGAWNNDGLAYHHIRYRNITITSTGPYTHQQSGDFAGINVTGAAAIAGGGGGPQDVLFENVSMKAVSPNSAGMYMIVASVTPGTAVSGTLVFKDVTLTGAAADVQHMSFTGSSGLSVEVVNTVADPARVARGNGCRDVPRYQAQ